MIPDTYTVTVSGTGKNLTASLSDATGRVIRTAGLAVRIRGGQRNTIEFTDDDGARQFIPGVHVVFARNQVR